MPRERDHGRNNADEHWREIRRVRCKTLRDPGTTALNRRQLRVAQTFERSLGDELVAPTGRKDLIEANGMTRVRELHGRCRLGGKEHVGPENQQRGSCRVYHPRAQLGSAHARWVDASAASRSRAAATQSSLSRAVKRGPDIAKRSPS